MPKKERRPIPTAPQDFDKVLKGEIKGKDLAKINQKASEEHNDSALESCQFCARFVDSFDKSAESSFISF